MWTGGEQGPAARSTEVNDIVYRGAVVNDVVYSVNGIRYKCVHESPRG
jgi:hypothetical protein